MSNGWRRRFDVHQVLNQNQSRIDIDRTFNNFELYDNPESIAEFTVPNECNEINILLNLTKFTKTQSFLVQYIWYH